MALAVHAGLLEVSASDDMFVTAFYGVLHVPTGALQYVRAGQDKPLLFRAEGGPPEPLEAEGRFLGMLENLVLEQRWVTLKPGDMLLTYSDGVPDARNEAQELLDVERVEAVFLANAADSAQGLVDQLVTETFHHIGAARQFDDITVMAARRQGP